MRVGEKITKSLPKPIDKALSRLSQHDVEVARP
jgi:hypothetical protein